MSAPRDSTFDELRFRGFRRCAPVCAQVAVRGVSFIEAARITYSMMTCSNVDYIVQDLLINSVVSLGALLCGAVGAAVGAAAGFAMQGCDLAIAGAALFGSCPGGKCSDGSCGSPVSHRRGGCVCALRGPETLGARGGEHLPCASAHVRPPPPILHGLGAPPPSDARPEGHAAGGRGRKKSGRSMPAAQRD